MLGYHEVRPSGSQTCPASSWSMKRPTRVPVSTVVRMKSASNMMAKWYQSAIRPWPNAPLKMWAMPTASDGAPPVRESSVLSPTDAARRGHLLRRHREAPAPDGLRRRLERSRPASRAAR